MGFGVPKVNLGFQRSNFGLFGVLAGKSKKRDFGGPFWGSKGGVQRGTQNPVGNPKKQCFPGLKSRKIV
jgi:hypothetical protein